MASRRTRSSIQLRPEQVRSKSLPRIEKTEEEKREYEKLKKQKQRAAKRGAEGPAKRGPKTKINIKGMSEDERKIYNREKQRLCRAAKKASTTDDIVEDGNHEDDVIDESGIDEDADIDMVVNNDQGAPILRLINSPSKKRSMPRQIVRAVRQSLSELKEDEILDVVVSLAHLLPQSVKDLAIDFGVKVHKIPKSFKRHAFSTITTSKKQRYKEKLVRIMAEYNDVTSAHAFVTLVVKTTELSESVINNFSKNGIEINTSKIPPSMRITHGINQVAKALCSPKSPESLEFRSDAAKTELMLNAAKEGNMLINNRGDVNSLASTFSISHKYAKRILQSVENGTSDELFGKRRKTGSLDQSEWPELIKAFCLTKPVCREAPGETVSIGYGVRAEKYIRQFSVEEIFKLFCLKYKNFPYKLTSFRKYVPKNLVSPSLRDVKRNTCPLHENLKRSVAALNRFFVKNNARDLIVPSSTIDLCLLGICHPPNDSDVRNPLLWSMNCTKGVCNKCGFDVWHKSLQTSIMENKLSEKMITYSQWITEYEGKKSKVVLRKFTSKIEEFLTNALMKSLSTEKFSFPEHLRKAWRQWELTKKPLVLNGEPGDVAIRTREDYQQDMKYLCLSETVSTHRGVGVITMVCYPVVLEIFHANEDHKELYGIIYMSDTKNKNFNTVFKLENKLFDYVEALGYNIKRYDRITDGCGSQFWCWGTIKHLEDMTSRVPLINFHRYERYEGKNMSDALGSMVKRKSNDSALRQRLHGLNEEGMSEILEDLESGTDTEDLVFENHVQAFTWLQEMMSKSADDKFSKRFDKIELVWIPDADIEKDLLDEKKVRKIPKIKSYNSVTSIYGKTGVFIKDSSCICEQCQRGEVLKCSDEKNTGIYQHNIITKLGQSNGDDEVETRSDEESEPEIEFDDNSEDEIDNDKDSDVDEGDLISLDFVHDEIPSTTPLNPGLYILYEYTETKCYVGCIVATLPGKRQVRFMRKFGVKGSFVTFTWPEEADEPIMDIETLKEKIATFARPNSSP